MSSLRASSLPLLMKCTGSLVLPCNYDKSNKTQVAADWGTMTHLWAQTGKISGPTPRLEAALERAIALSGIDRLELWPAGGCHEGELAIFVDTKQQGSAPKVSRDATERDGWVTGHYDYQWWLFNDELWVDDLKTGKYYPNPPSGYPGHMAEIEVGANRFPQDVDSPQLKTYALALSELLNYKGCVTVTLTHWPRLPLVMRHAPPLRKWTRYTNLELMEHWGSLERMYDDGRHNRLALQDPALNMRLNPGDHCRFCPSVDCLVRKVFE